MFIKVSIPGKIELRVIPSIRNLLFGRRREVHYIGGAEVLPPPLPLALLRAACAIINGGNLVTPHFGVYTKDEEGNVTNKFEFPVISGVISRDTSDTMKMILEKVVSVT